jgi:hypothetical protein
MQFYSYLPGCKSLRCCCRLYKLRRLPPLVNSSPQPQSLHPHLTSNIPSIHCWYPRGSLPNESYFLVIARRLGLPGSLLKDPFHPSSSSCNRPHLPSFHLHGDLSKTPLHVFDRLAFQYKVSNINGEDSTVCFPLNLHFPLQSPRCQGHLGLDRTPLFTFKP